MQNKKKCRSMYFYVLFFRFYSELKLAQFNVNKIWRIQTFPFSVCGILPYQSLEL